MRINILFLALMALLFLETCTPKVAQPVTKTQEEVPPPPPPVVNTNLSPCKKFSDSNNEEGAKTNHVLYRDFLKQKQYADAFPYWQKAYEMAPAADGVRDYHYLDGVKFYEHFLTTETDATKRAEYTDRILSLYDEASKCYEDKVSMYKGLKAFKLYYSFPDKISNKEKYELFKEVIDKEGKKSPDFVVNPFTALMVDLYISGEVSMQEARKYATKILEIVDYGTKNAKTANEKERWGIVNGYAPSRLESMEGVEGFYDCEYYKAKYMAEYNENPTDCETIASVYGRLKWGKCSDADPAISKLKPEMIRCFPAPVTPTAAELCSDKLRNGDYSGALSCYEEKANNSSDAEKKAQYYYTMARIYYSQFKKYSKARTYARKALEHKPGWGKPHLLIGKLYASSGALCGSGTGFDSQRITWVAIDEWNKARKDPETASEASKLIGKYTQYMPSKEDLFQRTMKAGDSYKVPCWIQQTTTIRSAP